MCSEQSFSGKTSIRRALPARMLQSDWLFDGELEVIIVHGEAQYRLRITRAGKLILTK